jgi:hypothetical protein
VCSYLNRSYFVEQKTVKKDVIVTEEYISEVPEIIENIKNSLTSLFNVNDGEFNVFPDGTKVNDVLYYDGEVVIDFSQEILNYGGMMWEDEIINQILSTVFLNLEIEEVTLTIDKNLYYFVEGTEINGYTREKWSERKAQYE